VQDDIQECTVHSLLTVVLNEAKLPEPVHKKLTRARVVPMISARLSRYAAPARNRLDAAPRPTLPEDRLLKD
jgi:hypothetical protein